MSGLCNIFGMKAHLLFVDVKQFAGKIGSLSRQSASNIDLQEPTSGFRVTFDEPDLENAPIDFGSFSINGQSPAHSFSYDYFLISTPRSSDEWQISPGPPDELRGPVSVTGGDELTARFEDITLPEAAEAPLPFDEASAEEVSREMREMEIRQELESFFADYPILPEPAEREVTGREPEIEMPDVEPHIAAEAELPVVEEQQQIPDLMPPDISVRAPEPAPDRPAPDRPAPDVRSPRSSPSPDRRRRTVHDDEPSFILGPVSVTDRGGRVRRRRRRLIVDQVTELSREQMLRNLRSTIPRPSLIDRIKKLDDNAKKSVASMLSSFGSFPKRFWRNRRTLPEPDDLSPFHVIPEEEPAPPDMPEEEIGVPDILMEDLQRAEAREEDQRPRAESREEPRAESREEARAEETHDDTHGLSIASKTQLSLQRSRSLRDQSTATRPSLTVPVIPSEDLSRRDDVELFQDILPESLIPEAVEEALIQEPEIALEVPAEFEEERDVSVRRSRKPCLVTHHHEKTPPPPSPEVPTGPLAEDAMIHMKEAFDESDLPDLITFSSLIQKTPGTRKYVANLFCLLLDLYVSTVIVIEQPEFEGEILI